MRRYPATALAVVAGMACLPATYALTRHGAILVSLLLTVLFGFVTGITAYALNRSRTPQSVFLFVLAFVLGALLSESISFALYYFTGHFAVDPKKSVGIDVSVIEAVVISIVGSLGLRFATQVARKFASTKA